MPMTTENKMKKFELIVLGLLVLILPNMETPKHVFWAMYMLVFLNRRYIEHGFSFNRPDGITLSVIALFMTSLLSTLINWPLEKSFSGSFYTLNYSALFLCLYHGGYTGRQIKSIILAIILGVVTGLFYGLMEYSSGISSSLGFHSVGVTTQSSIYLGIVIVVAIGLLLDDTDRSLISSTLIIISLFLMGTGLLYMGSRGAILATLICTIMLLILNHSRRLLLILSVLIATVTVAAFFLISTYPTNMNQPDKRERFSTERFQKSDNERIESWQIAVAKLSTGEDLVWGIGPQNFQSIDPSVLGIESSFYKRTGKLSHAHNLFLTQLVEQGIVGLAALLIFFFLVSMRLKNLWSFCKATNRQWIWAAGLGALTVPVIAGSFNTPFYREHAMLAMILMGALYAVNRKNLMNH
jgi:O-antigen ligase